MTCLTISKVRYRMLTIVYWDTVILSTEMTSTIVSGCGITCACSQLLRPISSDSIHFISQPSYFILSKLKSFPFSVFIYSSVHPRWRFFLFGCFPSQVCIRSIPSVQTRPVKSAVSCVYFTIRSSNWSMLDRRPSPSWVGSSIVNSDCLS